VDTQAAYDKIKRYFSKPGAVIAAHWDEDEGTDKCDYLGPDGAKCAIGCLIPAKLYTSDIEGKDGGMALAVLEQRNPSLFERTFGGIDRGFLDEAQLAHDESAGRGDVDECVESFLAKLDQVAFDYGLRVTSEPAFTTEQEESGEAEWERRTLRENL
jgi:hypothetical protein